VIIIEEFVKREATEEEIAEMKRVLAAIPAPEPTQEERLSALEAENAHLREALELLLSGVTIDG